MTRTYHKAENHSHAILDMWDRRKRNISQIARALNMDRATVRTHLRKHGRLSPEHTPDAVIMREMVANAARTMPSDANAVISLGTSKSEPVPDFSLGNRMYVVDGVMPAVVDEDGRPVPDRVGGILTALAAVLAAIVCVLVWNAVS